MKRASKTPVCDHLEYLMAMKDVQVDDCYFDELYGIEIGDVEEEKLGLTYRENAGDEKS
jgi:hypothetical protein